MRASRSGPKRDEAPVTSTTGAPSPAIAPSVLDAVRAALGRLGVDASGDPDAMFDRAETQLADPLIGVRVASLVPIGAYGLLEYGMRASASVGDALQRLARHYTSVSTRVRAEVTIVGAHDALAFRRHPGVRFSRHWIEMPAAAIARRIGEGAGARTLLHEVRFRHPSPGRPHDARYVEAFGAPVAFGASEDALVFADGALQASMSTAAAPVAASVDAELRALASREIFPDPTQMRVRAAIDRSLGEGASLAHVARLLHMSPRTLQRTLAQQGTSWTREVDEARRVRAMAALSSGEDKTTSIATELGFSDASAFFRAFRRWTGTTPGSYRAREPGDDASG
ncbi:MAG: AraC family transcriptional regulator ligand-binding domain-containing protein [Sandaracinus sp.]